MTIKIEKYRFENGSLYEFDAEQDAYVFCYSHPHARTEAQAIRRYKKLQQEL